MTEPVLEPTTLEKLARSVSRLWVVVAALSAAIAALLAVSAIAFFQAHSANQARSRQTRAAQAEAAQAKSLSQTNRRLLAEVADQARRANGLADAIQQQRLHFCHQANSQHVNSIRELNRLIAQAEHKARTAARRQRIRTSAKSSILLIDALAPIRNCHV